jgi:hypothetical protein
MGIGNNEVGRDVGLGKEKLYKLVRLKLYLSIIFRFLFYKALFKVTFIMLYTQPFVIMNR